MGVVLGGLSMSLDGFVSDRDGDVSRLYADLPEPQYTAMMKEQEANTGAVILGRRSYDMSQGDFTGYEFQVPIFVLTHEAPATVAKGENERLTFTFVTDGIERAVAQAKAAAGEKDVVVIGADTFQQCLRAGLLDEVHVSIVPVLLGDGLRMFGDTGGEAIELERMRVLEFPRRTDLVFRVLR